MSDLAIKRQSGFSLLEMTVAIGLGTIVLAAAVQMYVQGVSATWTVSQRAELQQDFRAASDMLTRDLSLAGAGLGDGAAIALQSTSTPVYGCDQAKCYLGTANTTAVNYPKQGAVPYLYGLLPGLNQGPTLLAAQGATDVVTVVYTDSSFYLNCYTAKITAKTIVTFSLPSPLTCVLPSGVTTPQNVNDTVAGLTVGDLVWFSFSPPVVAEVTSISSNVVTFANSDALKMNQTPSASTGLDTVPLNSTGTGTRIFVITYYIDNSVSPPRLMRQVSGHSPMPVAENVVYLKFSYDLYDSNAGVARTNQTDGGVSYGLLPNQITKINVLHMAMNSTLKGAQFGQGNGYQGLDLQTSVSARDLTYNNNYPIGP
jgi:prepilin-type N-terminal cleavage/methylation domain-containing protein